MSEGKDEREPGETSPQQPRRSTAYVARRIVQAATFIAFLALVVFAGPLANRDIAVDWVPRLSPLGALTTMMGSHSLIVKYWPALVLVVLTVLLSRFFCGWVCPLGTTIDLTDRLLRGRREARLKRLKAEGKGPWLYEGRRFKYYLVLFLVLGAVFGIQMAGWVDPLSIAPRTYSTVIHPYVTGLLDAVFGFLGRVPMIGEAADAARAAGNRLLCAVQQRVFAGHGVLLATLLLIVLPGLVCRRYWCRNLCPVGGILGLLSDWVLVKRSVSADCIHCRKCERLCRMGAIPAPEEEKKNAGERTTAGECVLCMDCRHICPTNAIRFLRTQPAEQRQEPDLSKRGLLTAGALSVAAVPLMRSNFPKKLGKGRLAAIRPPGALPEEDFLLRCVRCGECMRACPNHAIHPALLETGLEGLWTPKIIPRIGHCVYECTLCGNVCPSGALAVLTKEQKHEKAIGLARFNHNRCIPWLACYRLSDLKQTGQDLNCGTCEEVCPVPTKAIRYEHVKLDDGRELRLPYVKEELCVGCGYCENVCPVRGEAGVFVEGRQETITVAGAEEAAGAPEQEFFPTTVGDWEMTEAPTAYAGRAGLVKYIDGGAEPYLTYSFKQVVVARYARKEPRGDMEVSVWEFENASDAFGAMMKDILPEGAKDVKVGDESLVLENYLYGRKGNCHLRAKPVKGKVSVEDVCAVVAAVADLQKTKPADRPEVARLLPKANLVAHSEKYFRHQMILDSIYLTETPMNENVFRLGKETHSAVGDYTVKGLEFPFKLKITQYPNEGEAKRAFEDYKKLREGWKETEETAGDVLVFTDAQKLCSTLAVKGRYLVAAFRSQQRPIAEETTRAALKGIGEGK